VLHKGIVCLPGLVVVGWRLVVVAGVVIGGVVVVVGVVWAVDPVSAQHISMAFCSPGEHLRSSFDHSL
jgi:hypothetical protein